MTSGFQRYVSVHPSNRIEFYFCCFRCYSRPGAPPTRKRGKLAGQPTGPAWPIDNSTRPFGTESLKRQRHYRNDVTERQYGHGFTETVTETDTGGRKRNAGNQTLEAFHGIALYKSTFTSYYITTNTTACITLLPINNDNYTAKVLRLLVPSYVKEVVHGIIVFFVNCQLHVKKGSGRFVPNPPFCEYVYAKLIQREKV